MTFPSFATLEKSDWPVVGLILFIGWAVGMVTDHLLKQAQIRNLNRNSVKLQGDQLVRLQSIRTDWNNANVEAGKKADELKNGMLKKLDLETIGRIREELCEVVLERVVKKFLDYVEWVILEKQDEPKEVSKFIKNFLIPELERWADWLRVINRPVLLDTLQQNPAKVSERFLDSVRGLIQHTPKDKQGVHKAQIDAAIQKVLDA